MDGRREGGCCADRFWGRRGSSVFLLLGDDGLHRLFLGRRRRLLTLDNSRLVHLHLRLLLLSLLLLLLLYLLLLHNLGNSLLYDFGGSFLHNDRLRGRERRVLERVDGAGSFAVVVGDVRRKDLV